MSKDEITYKDLTKAQLESLKDKFIESRINQMTENDLRLYVRTAISDQIKYTVGNEEEREAWKEMRDHFDSEFQDKIKEVVIDNKSDENSNISPEQQELENRLKYLEERKKEKDNQSLDMW